MLPVHRFQIIYIFSVRLLLAAHRFVLRVMRITMSLALPFVLLFFAEIHVGR